MKRGTYFRRSSKVERAGVSPKSLEPKKRGPKKKVRPLPPVEDLQKAIADALSPERLENPEPPLRAKGTSARLNRKATGRCHECDRPVTGERWFCGPCMARRKP